MSGIAGYFQTEFDTENNHALFAIFENKLLAMRHGTKVTQDDKNFIFMEKHVGLVSCMLSAVNNQMDMPKTVTWNNKVATIVFTGKITNRNYLITKLPPMEFDIEKSLDSVVVLYCYLIYGANVLSEIQGSFSFAIYENNSILLARDCNNHNLLYYQQLKNHFVFASESKDVYSYGRCATSIKELLPGYFLKIFADHYGRVKCLKKSYQ